MADAHHFNNISLGGRGGGHPGQFKLYSGGLAWKKQGGGKIIEVDKGDITNVAWMRIPKSYQLSVGTKEGLCYRFFGFREQDVSNLTNFIEKSTGITPEEKQLSVSGQNWGGIQINGNMLCFNVGSKEAFEVSLADVAQTQMQGKTDVVLEFHVDDTTGANEKDSLMDLSFHVPTSNTQFIGDEHRTSAQMLWQAISVEIDGGGSSEMAVVTFDGIAILTPRGRYSVELHQSFLRLQGQANDFKIQYSSILRLFVLPKSHNPHTFVVITLDPPIRKGQTLYPHIVIQFETEAVVERELTLSGEILAEKYKDRLESSYRGLIHEVFSKVLRGLSSAKVTRPSTFRSCLDGYAVKSSLKAEDGLLYPLEKGFFFLPKPPTLIPHEEIEYVEFERHGAGGASISSHYFDLLVKLTNDQELLFRNIQRNEYHNLFNFISGKHLKILNLGDGQGRTSGVTAVLQSTDDDSVDPHLERIKNQAGNEESDEEDEDFVADKDDSGSPTDDSDAEGSDASMSGGEKEKPSKKEASSSKPPVKKKQKSGPDEGSQKKKPKKKKDPNAPKRAIAPFMYFSKAERANIKSSNPELATTEIAKKLGERWQKMTAEERQPYVEQSQVDKQRYAEESAAYRGAAAQQGSGAGSE
ncbi:FACT complex subunit SSRP1-B [Zea mays]|uniref:FACT complex subunit SSRP1 n=2 Tax=Zea mays TaxID=4577 RepID=A0A1D6LZE9_MAIZE|nr:FACT complex subunit SSRP1-B [Zea mays]AQK84463.1 FACT complex subunit SSRP1 [Zea mays]|eukprot:NP_001337971.1 FACT complex subunit SSRP1-B [Zea mays]